METEWEKWERQQLEQAQEHRACLARPAQTQRSLEPEPAKPLNLNDSTNPMAWYKYHLSRIQAVSMAPSCATAATAANVNTSALVGSTSTPVVRSAWGGTLPLAPGDPRRRSLVMSGQAETQLVAATAVATTLKTKDEMQTSASEIYFSFAKERSTAKEMKIEGNANMRSSSEENAAMIPDRRGPDVYKSLNAIIKERGIRRPKERGLLSAKAEIFRMSETKSANPSVSNLALRNLDPRSHSLDELIKDDDGARRVVRPSKKRRKYEKKSIDEELATAPATSQTGQIKLRDLDPMSNSLEALIGKGNLRRKN